MTGFDTIYEEHSRKVYRYLLALTGSEDAAEELLQETFFQALRQIGTYKERSGMFTWLCAIAKNLWKNECRRRNRFADGSPEELTLPNSNPTPEEACLRSEDARRIRRAAESLPEPYGQVFLLRTVGGLKLTEIAAIYEKTESWARVTYFRARQKIIEEVLK